MVLLPMVDSGAASQVQRCPLREGRISTDRSCPPVGGPARSARPSADLTDRELKLSGLRSDKAGLSPRPDRREAMLSPEDVLLAAVDAAGRTFRAAVWRGQRAQATYSSNVICLRPDTSRLAADYLAAWLMLPTAQKRIYAVARSARGMHAVNPVRLLDVDLEVPSMAEQEAFVQRLAP